MALFIKHNYSQEELDKLDENVEKAVDNLKQAMAVVARIKIRLQKHIEKHDQYKSFY
ncbi:hypothetical protein DAPPUDRAFT_344139, partial [Daphnia pulex]